MKSFIQLRRVNAKTFNIVVSKSKGVNKGYILDVLGKYYNISDKNKTMLLEIDIERLKLWERNGSIKKGKLKDLLEESGLLQEATRGVDLELLKKL